MPAFPFTLNHTLSFLPLLVLFTFSILFGLTFLYSTNHRLCRYLTFFLLSSDTSLPALRFLFISLYDFLLTTLPSLAHLPRILEYGLYWTCSSLRGSFSGFPPTVRTHVLPAFAIHFWYSLLCRFMGISLVVPPRFHQLSLPPSHFRTRVHRNSYNYWGKLSVGN